jgi:ribose transport system permease protein
MTLDRLGNSESAQASRSGTPAGRPSFAAIREYGVLLTSCALFLALSLTSPAFLTSTNLVNILSQQAPILIVAAAGTLVLISGGFDLSVGAVAAMAGIVSAGLADDVAPFLGVVAAVLCGGLVGCVNGVVVTWGRVSSLIGTLATTFIIRGIAVVTTGGLLITATDPTYMTLGNGHVVGIPIAVLVMVCVVGALGFVLAYTSYGRQLFAVGASIEASRLSGIRINTVRASVFVVSGMAAGLAGAILASRVATGQPNAATGLEFTVLAAIVVGGTSIQGGEGAVWRTVCGVLLIAMIDNGFTLLGIDPIYKQIVQGAIILAAVAVDAWARRPGSQ